MTADLPTALLILLVTLQALDAVTTYRVLQAGGVERNPVAKAVMDKLGAVPAMLLIKAIVIGAFVYAFADIPLVALIAACAYSAWVVVNNIQVLRKLP
jgi:hypothetical protein